MTLITEADFDDEYRKMKKRLCQMDEINASRVCLQYPKASLQEQRPEASTLEDELRMASETLNKAAAEAAIFLQVLQRRSWRTKSAIEGSPRRSFSGPGSWHFQRMNLQPV
jgi:hypothetical protein